MASQDRTQALIGRIGEQSVLARVLDAAEEGHGGLVLLAGEAGIGKSALADRGRG